MDDVRLTANGVPFVALAAGSGKRRVLLMHGFPDDPGSFGPLMERLADAGYRAVAPYMRGYGPTGPAPDGRYDADVLADDALALLDRVGGERTYLVGHDWGAVAAYLAAIRDPGAMDGLVGMSVPPSFFEGFLQHPRQLLRSWYMFFFQLPGLPEWVIRWRDMAFVEWLWRRWSPGWTPPSDRLEAVKDTFRTPGTLRAALAYYRQTIRRAARDLLAGRGSDPAARGPIPVPGLVMAGRRDGCVGPELFEGSQSAFAGRSRLEYVSGAGHFLPLEAPDRVAGTIVDFLGGDGVP